MTEPVVTVTLKRPLPNLYVVGTLVSITPDAAALEIVWISRHRLECGVRRLTAAERLATVDSPGPCGSTEA